MLRCFSFEITAVHKMNGLADVFPLFVIAALNNLQPFLNGESKIVLKPNLAFYIYDFGW